MSYSMLINCDLGESFGEHRVGDDANIMPHLDQANIACGFHGGDPLTIRNTLLLAAQHGVSVGAHPAYPDLEGFGRRRMQLEHENLLAILQYQLSAIEGMARSLDLTLAHIKPHGALYHDMMSKPCVRAAILEAVAAFPVPLTLIAQASTANNQVRTECERLGIAVAFEAFADRAYEADGTLVARAQEGAVLSENAMLAQVKQLCTTGSVTAIDGSSLALQADTLCVHGDTPGAATAIRSIRAIVDERYRGDRER